jgi:hypothetical protein
MRRFRAAACAWMLGTVVLVGAGLPSRAADSSPADALLDRARDAVATHEFSGVVRISWRNASGQHWKRVSVRAVDGGLRIAGGDLVEEDGRAWLRTQTRWETLWAGKRAPDAPGVGLKYTAHVDASGPTIASRPTKVLTIERSGHVVERYAFDRENGLVLRRERFDDDGRTAASMTFVRLGPITAASGTLQTPPVDKGAPRPMSRPPADAHRRVGDGFVLVGAQRVGAETQLLYSDGVFSASVFTRDGAVDWDSLPAGGDDVRMNDTKVRRYRTAGGTVLTWESGDTTFTCVTDASDADQRAILASVDGGDDGGLTDAVRFVTSPFSWF